MSRSTLGRWLLWLWGWWAICVALVVAVTAAGWWFSLAAFWSNTDADEAAKIRALQSAFAAVAEKQQALLLDLRSQVVAASITPAQLEATRQAASPFFKIYYVREDGQPMVKGDSLAAPAWMLSEGRQLDVGVSRTLFPVPAGADLSLQSPPPDNYFTGILRGTGCFLIADTDLNYLFGPWLQDQCRIIDVGTATATRVDHSVMWTFDPQHPNGRINLGSEGAFWEHSFEVIPTHDKYAFDGVKLRLELGPEVWKIQRNWVTVAAVGALVLGGFAISLALAGAAIRRDLAAAHVRANFTAMVSHELKTPVAAICMTTEILQAKLIDDPAKIEEYHGNLFREAQRLRRLIDNVMRVLGLGSHAGLQPVDLAPIVREVNEGVAVEMPDDLPPVLGDAEAAARAIDNLVQNALKYGGKTEDVLVRAYSDRKRVTIEVLDRGPGIPRRHRQAVFEPYFRLQDEDRREKPGTGLGLALVKVCMERQAGDVRILDRPGGGSIFRLTFRRASA